MSKTSRPRCPRKSLSRRTLSFVQELSQNRSLTVPRPPSRTRDRAALQPRARTRCFHSAMAVAATIRVPAKAVVVLLSSRRYPAVRHRNLLVALRELGTRFLVAWVPVRKLPEAGTLYRECRSSVWKGSVCYHRHGSKSHRDSKSRSLNGRTRLEPLSGVLLAFLQLSKWLQPLSTQHVQNSEMFQIVV